MTSVLSSLDFGDAGPSSPIRLVPIRTFRKVALDDLQGLGMKNRRRGLHCVPLMRSHGPEVIIIESMDMEILSGSAYLPE